MAHSDAGTMAQFEAGAHTQCRHQELDRLKHLVVTPYLNFRSRFDGAVSDASLQPEDNQSISQCATATGTIPAFCLTD